MATILTTWPGQNPDADFFPGSDHTAVDVQGMVESHNHLIGYHGKGSGAQAWDAGQVQDATGGMVTVLETLHRPRLGMTTVRIDARCDSDNGGTLQLASIAPAVSVNIAVGAGTVYISGTLTINNENTLTTLKIGLQMAGGGTYIDLLAHTIVDEDLTAGTLP